MCLSILVYLATPGLGYTSYKGRKLVCFVVHKYDEVNRNFLLQKSKYLVLTGPFNNNKTGLKFVISTKFICGEAVRTRNPKLFVVYNYPLKHFFGF
jgi:hypothetical protein